MSYLLYCIFHGNEARRPAALQGVDGQPVFPVAINGISAAVSEISDAHPAPDVPRVMAYQKVIASFHGDRTVIPMRYGCVLKDGPEVIQLLNRNARRYESLLKELSGCVEMGIRVLIEDLRNSDPQSKIQNPKSKITGRAYLAARKDHYAQEKCITEAKNKIAGQFRTALSGLYVKCKVETPSIFNRQADFASRLRRSGYEGREVAIATTAESSIANLQSRMLSLYFLVPGKSIDSFRQVFRRMGRRMETTKLLLSGPWPPYNFVLAGNEQRRPGLPDEETKER